MSYEGKSSPNQGMMGVETHPLSGVARNKGPRNFDDESEANDDSRPSVLNELLKLSEMLDMHQKLLSELTHRLDPILEPDLDGDHPVPSVDGDEYRLARASIFQEIESIQSRLSRATIRARELTKRVQL